MSGCCRLSFLSQVLFVVVCFSATGLLSALSGGIAIVVGLLIFLLIVLLSMCFRKKMKLCFKGKGRLDVEKLMLRKFNYEELQKATNDFSTNCLLGYGAFGDVYRGTFETEGTLAIKELLPASRTTIEEFQNEIILISKVKHENLVRLVGFCEPGSKGRNLLIYEYVCNGSLLDYIMGNEGRSLRDSALMWRDFCCITDKEDDAGTDFRWIYPSKINLNR